METTKKCKGTLLSKLSKQENYAVHRGKSMQAGLAAKERFSYFLLVASNLRLPPNTAPSVHSLKYLFVM